MRQRGPDRVPSILDCLVAEVDEEGRPEEEEDERGHDCEAEGVQLQYVCICVRVDVRAVHTCVRAVAHEEGVGAHHDAVDVPVPRPASNAHIFSQGG